MEQVQNQTIKNYNDMQTPHNQEAEKATIGALLLEKTAVYEVMDFLKPEMFYNKELHEIYSVILEVESTSDVDLITVFEGLKKRNSKVDISLLVDLSSYTTTAIHIKTHAMIVFQDYMRRTFIKKCAKSLADSNDLSMDIDDLISNHIFEVENLSDLSDVGTTISIDKLTVGFIENTKKGRKEPKMVMLSEYIPDLKNLIVFCTDSKRGAFMY